MSCVNHQQSYRKALEMSPRSRVSCYYSGRKIAKGRFMALSVKHPDADRLARSLADATGQSITNAVLLALREQLRRETGRGSAHRIGDELRAISDRCAALPDYDARTPEEI